MFTYCYSSSETLVVISSRFYNLNIHEFQIRQQAQSAVSVVHMGYRWPTVIGQWLLRSTLTQYRWPVVII